MRNFLKYFASLLALFVFVLIGIFLLAGLIGTVSSSKEVETGTKAVLFIDLKETFRSKPSRIRCRLQFRRCLRLYRFVRFDTHDPTR